MTRDQGKQGKERSVTAEEMIDGAIAAYESGEWEEWLAWLSARGVRVGVPEFQMETSGWYHEMTLPLLASAGSFTTTANICPTGRVAWVEFSHPARQNFLNALAGSA